MVYLDPPLDIENEAIFFADLNLYIKSLNGIIYHGNNIFDGEPLTLIERIIVGKEDNPSNRGVLRTVLAIIFITLVASIILVVLILWRKKDTGTSSLSMKLLPNTQTIF